MRKYSIFSLLGILAWAVFAFKITAEAESLHPGTWSNELESKMTITSISPDGMIRGTYTTNVGCDANKPQPLIGWYYENGKVGAITFSVIWKDCFSVTSWSGEYEKNTEAFQTLWHLVSLENPSWKAINAGTER